MASSTAVPPPYGPPSRMAGRAGDREKTLRTMRGALLMTVSLIVVGYVTFALIWLGLFVSGNRDAAAIAGIISLILNIVVNIVVLFLAWITLDGLGRIERETDRVQQFMDNVYRRLR